MNFKRPTPDEIKKLSVSERRDLKKENEMKIGELRKKTTPALTQDDDGNSECFKGHNQK